MNSPSGKQELLAFQDRWLKPAGMLAILGALVFAAGLVVQQVGLESADTDAEQLQLFHDHATKLIAGQIVQAAGFALFTVPLYVLFRAASARAERMRRRLLPLALLGPILFLVATVIVSFGLRDVADKFVQQAPAVEQKARQAAAQQAKGGSETEKPNAAEGSATATSGAGTTGTGTTVTGTTATGTTGTSTTAGQPKAPDAAANDAREDLADDLSNDSTSVQVGSGLRLTSTIALLFGLIYTPLWALRTGLLTRFWASVGMALGAALILVGLLGVMGLVLWFAALGLMLAGWWPGPMPPAWAAGEAIPWPRPGDEIGPPPPPRGSGTVEGSGREVSEASLPEDGHGAIGQVGDQPPGETQGQRRKKRKRRG